MLTQQKFTIYFHGSFEEIQGDEFMRVFIREAAGFAAKSTSRIPRRTVSPVPLIPENALGIPQQFRPLRLDLIQETGSSIRSSPPFCPGTELPSGVQRHETLVVQGLSTVKRLLREELTSESNQNCLWCQARPPGRGGDN